MVKTTNQTKGEQKFNQKLNPPVAIKPENDATEVRFVQGWNKRRRGIGRWFGAYDGLLALLLFGAGAFLSLTPTGNAITPNLRNSTPASQLPVRPSIPGRVAARFGICGSGARLNCVVDGDTFYVSGEKIRIADINAPEVSQPKCSHEAQLAQRSTQRLLALLNEGPIELRRAEHDKDRYGRSLRTVHRNGQSLGVRLVGEGLAHIWRGRKEDWCGQS